MPAQVRRLANPARSYAAEVREIAAAADFRTRSFAVRLSLPQADQHLPLGSSAVAGFASAAGAGTLLSLPAVGQFRGRSVVWAVDAQGEVQPREVELLALREDGALIGSGPEPGLQVVLAGTHRLSPGQIVRVLAEDAPVALDARR